MDSSFLKIEKVIKNLVKIWHHFIKILLKIDLKKVIFGHQFLKHKIHKLKKVILSPICKYLYNIAIQKIKWTMNKHT